MSDDPSDGPEPDSYRTLAGAGHAEFVVRGSEFLGYARPVESVAAAEALLEEVRERHPDATHHVPAYRVRADPFREYQSDDGEPSGSAGKPALNVLQGQDVENAACVVVRYYGGTNLGVGGLVRAYSRAVKEAVADAGVVSEVPHERIRITVEYDDSGTVRGIVESVASEYDADYQERVTFEARVPTSEAETFRDRIRSATSGRAEIE